MNAASESVTPLREVIRALKKHHGPPEPPPATEPFELILWENVAYLAPSARRREAFDLLRRTVGTTPDAILAAGTPALEAVTSHGILKRSFATKLRECARIATREFGGEVDAAIRGPISTAKKVLRLFPGIGGPGADKILLLTGHHACLAPDSNAIRVLVRIGLVREQNSYARTYRACCEAAGSLPAKSGALKEAHLLLQHHGQTLCRRNNPLCVECPLRRTCRHARNRSLD